MIPPLERLPNNPLITPADISFTRASGAFNPGAAIDHRSGRVVMLVRVFEADARRSCLALAFSSDGWRFDEIWDRPAVTPEEPYEQWGIEDPRITFLADEGRYAITYTGYSPDGPRACLITTDDLLSPERYRRHGPRIAGENKNCVIFPRKIDGQYVILHRPLPHIACVRVAAIEDQWPVNGTLIVGPRAGTWRSARVGAGAPPIPTDVGWLLPIHGATHIDEGNVYSMGWCVLDLHRPERVLYVSGAPVLVPEAPYEIELGSIPQVDPASFKIGVRVVFPEGFLDLGEDFLIYYGAADVSIAAARVGKRELIASLASAIARNKGAEPL